MHDKQYAAVSIQHLDRSGCSSLIASQLPEFHVNISLIDNDLGLVGGNRLDSHAYTATEFSNFHAILTVEFLTL